MIAELRQPVAGMMAGAKTEVSCVEVPRNSSSSNAVRAWIQAGQDSGGKRGAEAMEGAAYWLASPGLFSLLSYRTQDHQPRVGTTHNGPSLITN